KVHLAHFWPEVADRHGADVALEVRRQRPAARLDDAQDADAGLGEEGLALCACHGEAHASLLPARRTWCKGPDRSRSARRPGTRARESENDRHAAAVSRLRPEIATMRPGELARDREPQPGPLLLGGEEGSKDRVPIGLGDPRSPIRYHDLGDPVV